jgi:hypothetical protein
MLPIDALRMRNPVAAFTSGQDILSVTGAGTYIVPAGFNPSNNTIELIGGGGGGSNGTGAGAAGGGGGGGQYAKLTNHSLTPGASISYQVAAGGKTARGTSAVPGVNDTWFESSTTVANEHNWSWSRRNCCSHWIMCCCEWSRWRQWWW